MGTGSFIMRPRPDSAKMTKITLDRVLQDSRALSLLEKYLQRTRALDVLQFWLEVEAFQNTGWKANAVLGINSGVRRSDKCDTASYYLRYTPFIHLHYHIYTYVLPLYTCMYIHHIYT